MITSYKLVYSFRFSAALDLFDARPDLNSVRLSLFARFYFSVSSYRGRWR